MPPFLSKLGRTLRAMAATDCRSPYGSFLPLALSCAGTLGHNNQADVWLLLEVLSLCCAEYEQMMATHPCEWAHEGETCSYAAAKFFPGAYLRALPVYLPVYILPAILVHR